MPNWDGGSVGTPYDNFCRIGGVFFLFLGIPHP